MTDLQKLRNDLAKKYAEGFRYVDWHNTIEIYHAGFDAAVSAMQARVDELETKLGASDIKMQELFFENEKLKYKYDDPETWINKNYHDAEMKELEARSDSLNTQVELNEILKQQLEIAVKALGIVSFLKNEVHWVAPNNRDELRTLLTQGEQALEQIQKMRGGPTTTAEPKGVKE